LTSATRAAVALGATIKEARVIPRDGFAETDFLSVEITKSVPLLRAENQDWFRLSEDLNAVLMRTAINATATVHDPSISPRAVAVRMLLRSCGSLQGVVLLTERGMVTEGRTLARSLYEVAFCVAALIDRPDEFVGRLRDDAEASRKKQADFILAEKLLDDATKLEKLRAALKAMRKTQRMNMKSVAGLGALLNQYLAYQRLSDDSVHISIRSLHRHVLVDENRSGWNYQWCVGTREANAATLHHATLAGISIGIGITQLLGDTEGNSAFAGLAERQEAMPRVTAV
jgi:hypothetical protein